MNHFEFGFFDELSKIAADAAGEPNANTANANTGAPKRLVSSPAAYSKVIGPAIAQTRKQLESQSMLPGQLASRYLKKQAFFGSNPEAPPPVAHKSSILPGMLLGGALASLPALAAHSGVDLGIAEKMYKLPDLAHDFKQGLMHTDMLKDPDLVAEKSKAAKGFFFDTPSAYDQQTADFRKEYIADLEDRQDMASNLRNTRLMSALPAGAVLGGAVGYGMDRFGRRGPQ